MSITNFKRIDTVNGVPVQPSYVDVNRVSGTSYTVAASDIGDVTMFTSNDGVTVTLPETTIPIGRVLTFVQYGDGTVTIAPSAGVTIIQEPGVSVTSPNSVRTRSKYARVELVKVGENEWLSNGFGIYVQEDAPTNPKPGELWFW